MRERIGPNEAAELARGVFEERIVTRGTEIDRTATVSMASVLRYFEHTRWCVMQRPLLGLIDLIDQGHFFVVRSQVVELRRRIGQGQPLILTTRFLDVGRSTATVVHEALRERDGAVVARARVTGVWLGPSRRPVRIPDSLRAVNRVEAPGEAVEDGEQADGVVDLAEELGGEASSFIAPPEKVFTPLSVKVEPSLEPPEPARAVHRLVVPSRDLDVFSHVNAATFLHYADDAREAEAERLGLAPDVARGFVARVGLFYQREARRGDLLALHLVPLGERALGVWCRREGRDGEEPLVAMRLDLVPGARAVTEPGPGVG